ncbi:MAG TPA: RnfABCDGE type electron transport complex subunit B [Firmicutes bacterium]|nr:RnfABCDGE type electron transport complex subunit B [Bacillota bacterium]
MLSSILAASLSMGLLAVAFAVLLVWASRRFTVQEDPRVELLANLLPGANCGACGFSGCSGFAKAAVEGKAPADGCRAGGPGVAARVAEVLGVAAPAGVTRQVAHVFCAGTQALAKRTGEYRGLPDCRAAELVSGGGKACTYGCLGFGTCVEACPFDALTMGPEGLPVVDERKCTGCGICTQVCPRGVIQLVDAGRRTFVNCLSPLPGKLVRQVCQAGCIACNICERLCEHDAIHVLGNLATITPELCIACGQCSAKCPTHVIECRREEEAGEALPAGAGQAAS